MIYGEPLSGRHGVLAYSVQSVWGTPVTPSLCAGMVGVEATENPDLEELFGIGSANSQFARYKGQKNEATINIKHLQNLDFLTQGVRVSGALPILTLAFGLQDDAGTKWANVFQDCKIAKWEASLEQEGTLPVSMTAFLGKRVVSAAIARPSALTEFPFQWIDGVVSIASVGRLLKSCRIGVDHTLTRDFPIRSAAATADEARLPYRLREGEEKISGSVVTYQTLGISRQVDVPVSTTVEIALTSRADGTNTASFSATSVTMGEEKMAAEPDGDLEFTSMFVAGALALS